MARRHAKLPQDGVGEVFEVVRDDGARARDDCGTHHMHVVQVRKVKARWPPRKLYLGKRKCLVGSVKDGIARVATNALVRPPGFFDDAFGPDGLEYLGVGKREQHVKHPCRDEDVCVKDSKLHCG